MLGVLNHLRYAWELPGHVLIAYKWKKEMSSVLKQLLFKILCNFKEKNVIEVSLKMFSCFDIEAH